MDDFGVVSGSGVDVSQTLFGASRCSRLTLREAQETENLLNDAKLVKAHLQTYTSLHRLDDPNNLMNNQHLGKAKHQVKNQK